MSTTTKPDQIRNRRFDEFRKALDEGLAAIQRASTVEQAEEARLRARARLLQLNQGFANAFDDEQ